MNLKPCPCGQVPPTLVMEVLELRRDESGNPFSYRLLIKGSCCEEWIVDYSAVNGESMLSIATDGWNAAPRGKE